MLNSSWTCLPSFVRCQVSPWRGMSSAKTLREDGRVAAPLALPGEQLHVTAVNFSASVALARRRDGSVIRIALADVPCERMWSEIVAAP